jgi:hypothetical protein
MSLFASGDPAVDGGSFRVITPHLPPLRLFSFYLSLRLNKRWCTARSVQLKYFDLSLHCACIILNHGTPELGTARTMVDTRLWPIATLILYRHRGTGFDARMLGVDQDPYMIFDPGFGYDLVEGEYENEELPCYSSRRRKSVHGTSRAERNRHL